MNPKYEISSNVKLPQITSDCCLRFKKASSSQRKSNTTYKTSVQHTCRPKAVNMPLCKAYKTMNAQYPSIALHL